MSGPRVLRRTVGLARPYRRTALLAAAWMLAATLASLAGPLLVRYAIDQGIRPHHPRALRVAVIGFVAAVVIAFAASRQQTMAVARVGEGFLRDLRVRVFDHLLALSLGFYDREKAGVLVSRMTSDVDSMAELVQFGLLHFVSNGLLFVLTITVLAAMSPALTLVCFAAVPPVLLASVVFHRSSSRAYLEVRDRIGQNLSAMQEGITGVRVIQAFGREAATVERFARSNQSLYDAHMESVRISVWYFPVIEFAGIGTSAAVIGVGGFMVHAGTVSVGTVVAFVLLLSNLFEPVQQLSQLFNTVQSSVASLQKLYTLLDTPPDVCEREGAVPLAARGELVFEGVSFGYDPSRPVLRDVDLVVVPGERIALVGSTGAGKSTLAKLAARFYDPTTGSISLDGVDLRDGTLASLRQRVFVVPQEGFLFAGTLRDNVRIGRPSASDTEVVEALRAVGVLDRFEALPAGLDTEVRERGSRLSAGERQLVSLARAALADPAVLVLDEATSNLDPGTEATVEEAIARLSAGRTVLVIAHRLSTAERADRVVVVDGGRLAEVGPHQELVARGGRYAALHRAWTADAGAPRPGGA